MQVFFVTEPFRPDARFARTPLEGGGIPEAVAVARRSMEVHNASGIGNGAGWVAAIGGAAGTRPVPPLLEAAANGDSVGATPETAPVARRSLDFARVGDASVRTSVSGDDGDVAWSPSGGAAAGGQPGEEEAAAAPLSLDSKSGSKSALAGSLLGNGGGFGGDSLPPAAPGSLMDPPQLLNAAPEL